MIQSTYTARSGLIAQQQRMDIIANNLANLSTVGYKSVRADFKDALYQTMVRPVQPQEGLNLQRGHGVLLGATTRDFVQGTGVQTGLPLDMMLNGDGFFTVQAPSGEEPLYTRDGAFRISAQEDGNYLVTGDGWYVLDTGGQPINLGDTAESNLSIQSNGAIWDNATNTQLGQLGIYTFMNRQGLESVAGNRFQATEASGEPVASTASVRQGSLESSNVDLATEMVRMIRAQRAFSLTARALTATDEMDAESNQIRR